MSKMEEDKQQDFRFSMDEVSPDMVLREDLQDTRIDRLSRRITIIAVLIPCIIGVVLFFLYLNLKKQVIQNQDTGTQSVQNLSRDIQQQLHDLSVKTTDLENAIANRAASIEKRVDELKFRLYKAENSLKKIGESKAGLDEQQALSKRIATEAARMSSMDESYAKKISALSATTSELNAKTAELSDSAVRADRDIAMMRVQMSVIEKNTIDREFLEQELNKEEQNREKKLEIMSGELDKKLNQIRNDLKKVEKEVAGLRKIKASSPPASKAPAPRPPAPPPNTSETAPGAIIEKDLN